MHRRAIGFAATALVLAGCAAFALDTFASRTVCGALGNDLVAGADASAQKTTAEELRTYGHLLFFDSDLRSATNRLATDLETMVDLERSVRIRDTEADSSGRVIVLAGTVNAHARDAQRACGIPAVGIFGA